jgi:hypothetical protein
MIAERLIRGALSTPLDVQVFGAVIMWVIGYIVFLVPPMQIAPELGRGARSRVEKACPCPQTTANRPHRLL